MEQQKLEKAKFKLRHWSWWLTTTSALLFVLTIANAALIFGQYNDYAYVMQGLYGSFFGIIAGPIGIRLSYVNQVHQMKRSWSAFVILCIFTTIGSIIGFLFGCLLSNLSASILSDGAFGTNKYYRLHGDVHFEFEGSLNLEILDKESDRTIPGLMAVETFLSIVLCIVSIMAACSFGCKNCCPCCYCPLFEQANDDLPIVKAPKPTAPKPQVAPPSYVFQEVKPDYRNYDEPTGCCG